MRGLTHWGAYSYGRWWKGLAARYVRPPAMGEPAAAFEDLASETDGGSADEEGSSSRRSSSGSVAAGGHGGGLDALYAYAELEHEAAGPTLTVGLWRLQPLPPRLLADRDNLRVQICLAKAKAFGIKRTVHRISLAYADLVGKRTLITWVQD